MGFDWSKYLATGIAVPSGRKSTFETSIYAILSDHLQARYHNARRYAI